MVLPSRRGTVARRGAVHAALRLVLRSAIRLCGLAVLGAPLVTLYSKLLNWHRLRKLRRSWKEHVDLSVLQACVLSTEHLADLGRVEKRTLFVKPIANVLSNEYTLGRVLEAAEKVAKSNDPILLSQLPQEDRYSILTECMNHLGSCFAPYHIFFNEARRTQSYYRSAWYVFTLTCSQNPCHGRCFLTPRNPVEATSDVGALRIRVIMMAEQELRDIADGDIVAPVHGFYNGRHENRWKICERLSELFFDQLQTVTRTGLMAPGPTLRADWGPGGVPALDPEEEDELSAQSVNCIARLHIPFPSSRTPGVKAEQCAKDVVLFE